jgi:hypothetical protein
VSPNLLALLLSLEVLYAAACGVLGSRPGAPLWLSWPLPIWRSLRGDRLVAPLPPRPDYERIDQLERELGFVQDVPMRPDRICLTKNCRGEWSEVRSWRGPLMYRFHTCEAS